MDTFIFSPIHPTAHSHNKQNFRQKYFVLRLNIFLVVTSSATHLQVQEITPRLWQMLSSLLPKLLIYFGLVSEKTLILLWQRAKTKVPCWPLCGSNRDVSRFSN